MIYDYNVSSLLFSLLYLLYADDLNIYVTGEIVDYLVSLMITELEISKKLLMLKKLIS